MIRSISPSLLLISFLIITPKSFSQDTGAVGIGTNDPDASAILEVASTNKGILIPRINGNNLIDSPVEGLIIYNEQTKSFEYYDGDDWFQLIPTPSKFNIDMANHKITRLANGTVSTDAVNKGQLDTSISTVDSNNLDRDGTDTMTGNLNMNNRKVINLTSGTNAGDAVNRSQLDTKANKTQDAWRNLTLINGYRVSNNRTPQYRVDEFGVVHLRGDIAVEPTVTNLIVTGAMDTDARPTYSIDLVASGDTAAGIVTLRVRSVGDISIKTTDLATPDLFVFHLSGVSYTPR